MSIARLSFSSVIPSLIILLTISALGERGTWSEAHPLWLYGNRAQDRLHRGSQKLQNHCWGMLFCWSVLFCLVSDNYGDISDNRCLVLGRTKNFTSGSNSIKKSKAYLILEGRHFEFYLLCSLITCSEFGEVDPEKLEAAIDTFVHSCAGYSVATYILVSITCSHCTGMEIS